MTDVKTCFVFFNTNGTPRGALEAVLDSKVKVKFVQTLFAAQSIYVNITNWSAIVRFDRVQALTLVCILHSKVSLLFPQRF